MSRKDDIALLLAGRAAMYRVLQAGFGNEPSQEILGMFCGDEFSQVSSLFVDDDQSKLGLALSDLIVVLKEGMPPIDQLESAYQRLFVGPGKLEAAPWESVYMDKDNALFQPGTLEVRKSYVAQGFIPEKYPHVADDHLGLELDFMTLLAEKAQGALEAGDVGELDGLLDASIKFLDEHLLLWIPSFCETLAESKRGTFYKELAWVMSAYIKVDRAALDEIKEGVVSL